MADRAVSELMLDTLARGEPYWAWSSETWIEMLGQDQRAFFAAHPRWDRGDLRQHMIAIAYLLHCFDDLPRLGQFERVTLALKVFGQARIAAAVTTVTEVLAGWGYANHGASRGIPRWTAATPPGAHGCPLGDDVDADPVYSPPCARGPPQGGSVAAVEHPDIREPSQWTRETCAAAVAPVDRMRVGDHVIRRP
jgi:hypothetical protein